VITAQDVKWSLLRFSNIPHAYGGAAPAQEEEEGEEGRPRTPHIRLALPWSVVGWGVVGAVTT